MHTPLFTSTLNQSTQMIGRRVQPGDLVVDATAGGGNDTAFLARLVGPEGMVHAFDIQEEAIHKTRLRLIDEGLLEQVRLHQMGHENMVQVFGEDAQGAVRAVMFNLGFLPNSSSPVVTSPETTLIALEVSLNLLAPDGVLSVVCYGGHEGGEEETQAVETWCRSLDFDRYRVLRHEICNKPGSPIVLFFVETVAA